MRKSAVLFLRLATGLLLLGVVCVASAQSFSTLEERMTAAQFHAAGLDKLSPEELAQLNAWLQENLASGATAAAPVADRTGLPSTQASDSTAVRNRITGEFRGWTGKTTFHLDNGQVWQQVGNDRWEGVTLDNPQVTIAPAFMGSWRLKVDGYNTATKVKRIR